MPSDPHVPPCPEVDDPLDQAPLEDREALRTALAEIVRHVGALPEPETEDRDDLGFLLVWRLPDGVIELAATKGQFSWYTEGALFWEEDERMLNGGHCVVPPPDSPEAFLGGTLIPRFRTWLARHDELTRLRDQILKELRKTGDPQAFMRHLTGFVVKKLNGGKT